MLIPLGNRHLLHFGNADGQPIGGVDIIKYFHQIICLHSLAKLSINEIKFLHVDDAFSRIHLDFITLFYANPK